MAKSKPIGVRFDLDKLDMIQKEQNLTSVQQVVNYLMENYGSKEIKRGTLQGDVKDITLRMFREFYQFMWMNRSYWEPRLRNA